MVLLKMPADLRVTLVHHVNTISPTAPTSCVPHQHGAVQPPTRGAMLRCCEVMSTSEDARSDTDTPNNDCRVLLHAGASNQGGQTGEGNWPWFAHRTTAATTRLGDPPSQGYDRGELNGNLTSPATEH